MNFRHRTNSHYSAWFVPAIASLLLIAGCSNNSNESTGKEDKQPVDDTNPVTIVIIESKKIDHLGLKAAINKQFDALSLGKATFVSKSASEFVEAPVEGDLIIYPPTMFGDLVKKNLLRTIPDYVVDSEPYAMNDLLRVQRRIFGVHDKSRYATSLGTSSFMLLCRSDILQANGLTVPSNWQEYEKVCLQLATRKLNGKLKGLENSKKPWSPAIEPLKENWKAATLLARTASSIRSSGRYSVCFDYSNWTPLISHPPFSRSLGQLRSQFELMDPTHQDLDPLEVENAFLDGQCVMALTWPHPPSADETVAEDTSFGATVHPLPGSANRFDFSQKMWKAADSTHSKIPFLGVGGFCCSILNSSKQSGVATRRLALITGKEVSAKFGRANRKNGFPYRASHLANLTGWMSARYSDSAKEECAKLISQQFESPIWMVRPRVERAIDYESSLANGIDAVFNKQPAETALTQVAEEWEKINSGVDREFQKLVNLESLGVK